MQIGGFSISGRDAPAVACRLPLHVAPIPFAHGEELFRKAENASPKRFLRIAGGGHNRDMPGPAHAAEFYEAIREITGR